MLRKPFEEGWKVSSGEGSFGSSQNQGVANDVGCAFDRIDASKSKTAFSDEQMGLQ